jgi:hypothetical protein
MTKTAQNWLDTKYSNKTVGGKIELHDKNVGEVEELAGELLIENYINVEDIQLERWGKSKLGDKLKGKITRITIKNCPKVKELNLSNNEISEIIFEGNFPDLVRLDAADNKLVEIDISKFPNLTLLSIPRNPITKIKGLEYSTKLEFINLVDTPGLNGREYGEWKDSIKNMLNIPLTDPLPNDLKTKLDELANRPTQKKLDEALENERKKVQSYENGLKTELGLSDNNLSTWKDKIKELKSKPAGTTLTPEEQQKLKNYNLILMKLEEEMCNSSNYQAFIQENNIKNYK